MAMNLKLLIIIFCYIAISPAGCNDKNVQPYFPVDLKADKKDLFTEKWNEGKFLFKADCARCHGIFTKGKDSIPNFTKTQLSNYTALFMAKDPKNHSVIKKIPPQDFYKILLFLTYLKREQQHGPPIPLRQWSKQYNMSLEKL
jgi:hypothetical protein